MPGAANLNILQLQSSANTVGDVEFAGIGNQKIKRMQFFVGAVRIHILSDTDDNAFFTPQSSSTNAGEYAIESGNSRWQNFANVTVNLPKKVVVSTNYYGNGNSPFDITTGFDNNGDGNFNDRPQFALPGQSGAVATPFGDLIASGGTGVLARNRASLPWNFHVRRQHPTGLHLYPKCQGRSPTNADREYPLLEPFEPHERDCGGRRA